MHVSRYQSCLLDFTKKLTNLNHDTIWATTQENDFFRQYFHYHINKVSKDAKIRNRYKFDLIE